MTCSVFSKSGFVNSWKHFRIPFPFLLFGPYGSGNFHSGLHARDGQWHQTCTETAVALEGSTATNGSSVCGFPLVLQSWWLQGTSGCMIRSPNSCLRSLWMVLHHRGVGFVLGEIFAGYSYHSDSDGQLSVLSWIYVSVSEVWDTSNYTNTYKHFTDSWCLWLRITSALPAMSKGWKQVACSVGGPNMPQQWKSLKQLDILCIISMCQVAWQCEFVLCVRRGWESPDVWNSGKMKSGMSDMDSGKY